MDRVCCSRWRQHLSSLAVAVKLTGHAFLLCEHQHSFDRSEKRTEIESGAIGRGDLLRHEGGALRDQARRRRRDRNV